MEGDICADIFRQEKGSYLSKNELLLFNCYQCRTEAEDIESKKCQA